MPSKLEYELIKLRGEVSESGEVYIASIAALQDALTAAERAIECLTSADDNLLSKVNRAQSTGSRALSKAQGSIKKSGDIMQSGSTLDNVHLTNTRVIEAKTAQGVFIKDSAGNTVMSIGVGAGAAMVTDNINEKTAATGVTIDTVLLKDGNVDGRNLSTDGTKLDAVEASADVTDVDNVRSSGAMMRVEGWVQVGDAGANIAIGTIPANGFIIRSYIDVTTLFNDSGTDQISIGISSDSDKFGTNTDVSATGLKTPAAGVGIGYNSTSQAVTAKYSPQNYDCDTGKALIVVEYYLVTTQP